MLMSRYVAEINFASEKRLLYVTSLHVENFCFIYIDFVNDRPWEFIETWLHSHVVAQLEPIYYYIVIRTKTQSMNTY